MNDNVVTMRRFLDVSREIESWIIAEVEPDVATVQTLIGAHINVYDYYSGIPILAFILPKTLYLGKIFKDVYLLSVDQIPEQNMSFLANGRFLRECLKTSMKDAEGNKVKLHTLDAIEMLFNSEDSREQIKDIQQNTNTLIFGVYRTDDIHSTRGL